jgi:hypothetical protein
MLSDSMWSVHVVLLDNMLPDNIMIRANKIMISDNMLSDNIMISDSAIIIFFSWKLHTLISLWGCWNILHGIQNNHEFFAFLLNVAIFLADAAMFSIWCYDDTHGRVPVHRQ